LEEETFAMQEIFSWTGHCPTLIFL